MRNYFILIAMLLIVALSFHYSLLAEGFTEVKSVEEGYSEIDFKVGTEVYEADISKLSEEELYIPVHQRFETFEREYGPRGELQIFLNRANYPNVNNYIKSNKLVNAKVELNHKSSFTKFNYRNGFGAVEGVVAHETANNRSTINNEITYMSRNHKNAFVHAFVDHNRIIEIHPLDLGAWGAGRVANQRYVHVELVRVHSFDHFAKSINNYSDYIANVLYDYGLGVSSAEKSGKGSLWSHDAVSRFLGGTDHVDPHGYFAQWGYNWNQFVSLVTEKHNRLVANRKANTSKLGHIRSSNARVYNDPTNLNSYSTAGPKNMNEVFYIKAEAKINGTNFYLLSREPSSKRGAIGWVRSSDITAHTHEGLKRAGETFKIHGNGVAYNKAWGGTKNQVYDLSTHVGKNFKVNLTESVGSNVWHRGILEGRQAWIHSSYLINESRISRLGHIRNADVNVYSSLEKNASRFKAGSKLTNSVYYIKEQAEVSRQTYYLISTSPSNTKGVVGWVNAKDLSTNTHVGVDKNSKRFYLKGTGSAYSKAWGGSQDLVYKDLSQNKYQVFEVNLTEKVGNNTWYRGTLNGKSVWLHSSYVTTKKESNTSRLSHLRSNAKIYSNIHNQGSYESAETYTNAVYYMKKQTEINGEVFYLISTQPNSVNGVVGWVNARDLSSHAHVGVDKKRKTFYIKGTGTAYSKAWGGSKDVVYNNLSQYKNKQFQVHLTEKVGNNTWYRGTLNGKTVWIHSSYLTSEITTNRGSHTSRLGHIEGSSVEIYPSLDNLSSSIAAGAEYMNAVYYIKKQADVSGQRYYLISRSPSSTQGVVGWVNAKNLSTRAHVGVDKSSKTFTIKGTGSAYSKAWGGSKDVVYNNLSQYKNEQFRVHLTEKVGNNTWYRGILNGKTVWLHSSYLTGEIKIGKESHTSRLGHIEGSAVEIYPSLDNLSSSITAGAEYMNAVYYIKKQVDVNGQRYYLISRSPSSTQGVVGWVNAKSLSTRAHVGVDKSSKTFTIKGTGSAYNKAWGGSQDLEYDNLSQFKGQRFNVHLTEKVGNNTWYRGTLQGNTVWIHSSFID